MQTAYCTRDITSTWVACWFTMVTSETCYSDKRG